MVAILLGADNGFFYAGQIMHFSSPFTVFLIYHKQCFTVNTQKKRIGVEIYINDDKELFGKFKDSRAEIEQMFGAKLEWIEATKACRILGTTSGDIKKSVEGWPQLFDWYMQAATKMRKIADVFDK